MNKTGEKILNGLIGAVASLPLGMLYPLADISYALLYHVGRYRRKITRRNLKAAFPDLPDSRIKAMEKEFYRNFADYIVETIRLRKMPVKELKRRLTFEGLEYVRALLKEGRTVVVYYSHSGNWEWVTLVGEMMRDIPNVQAGEVYRPLKNKWMDAWMLSLRTRLNAVCLKKTTVFRDMIRLIRDGKAPLIAFMSDQKPSHADRDYRLTFLGRETKVITGTETVARKLGAAAVFFDMTKLSRGRYHLRVIPMTENAADTPEFALTHQYFSLLEANIRRNPPIWLWSHNRWKGMPDPIAAEQ